MAVTNSTYPVNGGQPFVVKSSDVTVNILWFLSLILALFVALFAILVQGWLRHYIELPLAAGGRRAIIRQDRFMALGQWFVPDIVLALAIVLQVALVVFFSGLLVFLWSLNSTLALIMTVISAFLLTIYLALGVAPVFDPRCPYKSPVAWVLRNATQWALYITAAAYACVRRRPINRKFQSWRSQVSMLSWLGVDLTRFEANTRWHTRADTNRLIDIINWTLSNSQLNCVNRLCTILLQHLEPKQALFQWMSRSSLTSPSVTYSKEDSVAVLDKYDRATNNSEPDWTTKQTSDDMVTELLVSACHRSAMQPFARPDYETTFVAAIDWVVRTHDGGNWPAYLKQMMPSLDTTLSIEPIIHFVKVILQRHVHGPRYPGVFGKIVHQLELVLCKC